MDKLVPVEPNKYIVVDAESAAPALLAAEQVDRFEAALSFKDSGEKIAKFLVEQVDKERDLRQRAESAEQKVAELERQLATSKPGES